MVFIETMAHLLKKDEPKYSGGDIEKRKGRVRRWMTEYYGTGNFTEDEVTAAAESNNSSSQLKEKIQNSQRALDYDPIAEEAARSEQEQQDMITGVQDRARALAEQIAGQRQQLLSDTEKSGQSLLEQMRTGRAGRREELEGLLSQRAERVFSESSPEILEALSARGLLHSSGVGEELASERSRLAQISQEQLQAQSFEDVTAEERLAQGIQDRLFGIQQAGLGFEQQLGAGAFETETGLQQSALQANSALQQAGIQRGFSLQDIENQQSFAEKLAKLQAKQNTTSSILDLAGTVGGAFLPTFLQKGDG